MNLHDIAAGNYASLTGTWTEEAYAANHHDGNGEQWTPGGTDTLTVTSDEIDNATQSMDIRSGTLTSGSTSTALSFDIKGNYAEASLADQNVGINWQLGFYSGTAVDLDSHLDTNDGVQLDSSKNTIYIWSSNNGYAQVFSQSAAAPSGSASSTVPQTAACLSEAGFTGVLAQPDTTITEIVYCGGGVALTFANDCSNSADVCNEVNDVFQATGGHWATSSREAICDYGHSGASSPIPSTDQWFCNSN